MIRAKVWSLPGAVVSQQKVANSSMIMRSEESHVKHQNTTLMTP